MNCHHADAAACLLVDGALVAAVEEERLRREKHCGGFPVEAIRHCVRQAGISSDAITHVAVNRDRSRNAVARGLHLARGGASVSAVLDRVTHASRTSRLEGQVMAALGLERQTFRLCRVEHHLAHLASAFLASPYERAAVASIDGSGDFRTALWGTGEGSSIEVLGGVNHPHSLGYFYLAITQYLGFPHVGDEGKLMGLAALGSPRFADELSGLFRLRSDGRFTIDDRFIRPSHGGKPAYTDRLCRRFGPARATDAPIEPFHQDFAASAQAVFEQVYLHVLDHVSLTTGHDSLCLAGGCALNGVANGRLLERTAFRRLYVPPWPGDAGGAIGSALWVWHRTLGRSARVTQVGPFLGAAYSDRDIEECLDRHADPLAREGCRRTRLQDVRDTVAFTARRIADGAVTGWFQGGMEFGPRALGHRSILADPRRPEMRDRLNQRIKSREGFRPFAPAVLRSHAAAWFDLDDDVPYMNRVVEVLPERREQVPAVTHADGTARVQTVREEDDAALFALLNDFLDLTGVPLLINTSFNENEPIVNTPDEAIECFLRTPMDLLVLGRHAVTRDG